MITLAGSTLNMSNIAITHQAIIGYSFVNLNGWQGNVNINGWTSVSNNTVTTYASKLTLIFFILVTMTSPASVILNNILLNKPTATAYNNQPIYINTRKWTRMFCYS